MLCYSVLTSMRSLNFLSLKISSGCCKYWMLTAHGDCFDLFSTLLFRVTFPISFDGTHFGFFTNYKQRVFPCNGKSPNSVRIGRANAHAKIASQ